MWVKWFWFIVGYSVIWGILIYLLVWHTLITIIVFIIFTPIGIGLSAISDKEIEKEAKMSEDIKRDYERRMRGY
tara:strand:- start:290 stop:511 length:222 start_codon:yes stop_codon:yes gene_type:complete